MKSIRFTLLFWLSVGLTIAIFITAAVVYFQSRESAYALFDYQMKQLVASLPRQSFAPLSLGKPNDLDVERNIVIQIWDNSGLRVYQSHRRAVLPKRAELGFSNVNMGNRGTWRVYRVRIGSNVVQVAQPMSARREIVAQTALSTVAPMIVALPFLGILIWLTVGRGLAPIKTVAAEVQTRGAGTLAAIADDSLPEEIRPLTTALNNLMARLGESLEKQRAFVADAAHELRTPLTALQLQIQLAQRAVTDAERASAFQDLHMGIQRATHLVQQLLTLARQEPGASGAVMQPVDFSELVRSVVADFAPTAHAKHIDLGIVEQQPADVSGDRDALHVLVGNLIDNAIRYTPANGRIDISVREDKRGVSMIVQDNGGGIPESELNRVFDRFYRLPGTQAEGSGLGLAIVKQIAEAHRATAVLKNHGSGLRATITFSGMRGDWT